MNKLLLFISFFSIFCHCQIVPPPPPEPKQTKAETTELIEITPANATSNKYSEKKAPTILSFTIGSKEFLNKKSKYYHEKIKNRISNLDLTISDEEIIAYTKYRNSLEVNPYMIDSLSVKIYKLNEDQKYDEAIELSKELEAVSPNNLTLHKEISLAYKKIGKQDLSEKHFKMMIKIIEAVNKYGDGSRKNPYILNNFFEGISLYEAVYHCFPKKTRFILTESKNVIAGYDCYHIMNFADLNHYKKYLEEDTYKIE